MKKHTIVFLMILAIIAPAYLGATNAITKSEVNVIYDPTSSTPVKAEALLSELVDQHNIELRSIPVESQLDFQSILPSIVQSNDIMVVIGHGSWEGIMFGEDVIRWEEIRSSLASSNSKKKILISCYSSIVPLGLPEDCQDEWLGFDTEIDYLVATFASALEIGKTLNNNRFVEDIQQTVIEHKSIFFERAISATEPLWWGTTHNKLAEISTDDEIGSTYWNLLTYDTRRYADDANRADTDDGIIGA
ncbi:MAG: hypothetical protein ACFFEV_02925, partial [Candidatus Thorarchaeota archaeon]